MRHLVLSSGAQQGDSVLFALDLDGRFTPGIPYSWDTTSRKTPLEVKGLIGTMHVVAPHLTAGKDISNPGSLGTLGMLLESSGCGAEIDPDRIPRPGRVGLLKWLLAYQGCGFVVTCRKTKEEKVLRSFRARGFEVAACGRVTSDSKLVLIHRGRRTVLFDLRKHTFGCRPPQKI
jgi:selenophosphate synthetase-related protein